MNSPLEISPSELSPVEISRVIDLALAEDLASGDVTTRAVIPEKAFARGSFNVREPVVLSGLPIAARVFSRIDPRVEFTALSHDGALAEIGTTIATIDGPAHSVLTGERVALNLLQRLSGIATLTRRYTSALPPGAHTRITDTRKTTPGLRAFERYAVRCGGGHNHRNDLGAAVLIKDNHIAVCGGVRNAIERARAHAPHTMRIECEVQSLDELNQALEAKADVVMLDNFDDETTRTALERIKKISPRPVVEASGGISLARIATLGSLGVDVISVGALTHGYRSVDIGLDLEVSAS